MNDSLETVAYANRVRFRVEWETQYRGYNYVDFDLTPPPEAPFVPARVAARLSVGLLLDRAQEMERLAVRDARGTQLMPLYDYDGTICAYAPWRESVRQWQQDFDRVSSARRWWER